MAKRIETWQERARRVTDTWSVKWLAYNPHTVCDTLEINGVRCTIVGDEWLYITPDGILEFTVDAYGLDGYECIEDLIKDAEKHYGDLKCKELNDKERIELAELERLLRRA